MSSFWMIFSISFTVALSGACSPGPLLTYTVIKSMQTQRTGYLVGVLVITGHAILETAIIALLLFGFSLVLNHPVVVLVISIAGGTLLIAMGVHILVNVIRGKVQAEFAGSGTGTAPKRVSNALLGGILVSMSNPYWWVWWATIGFSLMLQLKVSFDNPAGLLAFFLGHEAGDLAWYGPVSALVFLGRKKINQKVYAAILVVCALAIIGFGLVLAVSAIIKGGHIG